MTGIDNYKKDTGWIGNGTGYGVSMRALNLDVSNTSLFVQITKPVWGTGNTTMLGYYGGSGASAFRIGTTNNSIYGLGTTIATGVTASVGAIYTGQVSTNGVSTSQLNFFDLDSKKNSWNTTKGPSIGAAGSTSMTNVNLLSDGNGTYSTSGIGAFMVGGKMMDTTKVRIFTNLVRDLMIGLGRPVQSDSFQMNTTDTLIKGVNQNGEDVYFKKNSLTGSDNGGSNSSGTKAHCNNKHWHKWKRHIKSWAS